MPRPEQWRPVREFPRHYQVSDRGRVRRVAKGNGARCGRVLRPFPASRGQYQAVRLSVRNRVHQRYVHRLVLEAFRGRCPRGLEARHRDGNAQCNTLSNLRWSTHRENISDKKRHGTLARGERVGSSKLTAETVRAIRKSNELQRVLASRHGVSRSLISLIKRRRVWRHL